MTEITPETQVLIDRLKRMDPAKPRQDKPAIEQAINTHLAALGLPERPFIWANDAWTVHRIIIKRVAAGYRGNVTSDGTLAAAGVSRVIASDLSRRQGMNVGWAVAYDAAWHAAKEDPRDHVWHAALDAAWSAALDATRAPAWHAVRHAIRKAAMEAATAARAAAGNVTREAVWKDNWRAFIGIAIVMARSAAACAAEAASYVNGFAVFNHPTTEKLVRMASPMLDAFEAGLFFYWITPYDVICVLQPSLSIENGRLHRADGPAAAWPSGKAYHFWRGVQVPARIIGGPPRSRSRRSARRRTRKSAGAWSRFITAADI